MKPPICEVCNARFSARTGALVTCAGDEKSAAWDRRQAAGSFPGHPPNKGWFCSEHREAAEQLAALLTLRQVVASIRGKPLPSDPPIAQVEGPSPSVVQGPAETTTAEAVLATGATKDNTRTCDVCGITFDEETAGLVRFARTPEGTAWHREMISGRVSGTNPDHAWLCARHVTPALWISRTLHRAEAMVELMPAGRPPLEYDERPPSADPKQSTFPPRTAFRPVVDGGLFGVSEHWVPIAPHPPRMLAAEVGLAREQFGEALGISGLRNGGSVGSVATDPADTRWATEGIWVGSSFSPYQASDVVIFMINQTFRSGDRQGSIVRQGLRILIQQRERSIFELTFAPAEPPAVAPDGLIMIERMLVRQSPALDEEVADGLAAVVRDLATSLSLERDDPFALAPDLIGVDLGSGLLERKQFSAGSTIRWDGIASTFDEALSRLFTSLPGFFEVLELGSVPELEHSVKRQWSPIDGAHPPHCPFTETKRWKASGDRFDLDISHRSSNWNEHDVANQSASLDLRPQGTAEPVRISIWEQQDRSQISLRLQRPTSAVVVEALRSLVDC